MFPCGWEGKESSCNVGDPGEGNGYLPSILEWRTPWTEEPGRLQSMGSQRIRHDWGTSDFWLFIFLKTNSLPRYEKHICLTSNMDGGGGYQHSHDNRINALLTTWIQNHTGQQSLYGKEECLSSPLGLEVSVGTCLGWIGFQEAQYTCECHQTKSPLSLKK